ncbi:hypothetical protein AN958_01294, partial [Leucoagaricus sp. SymC.cos]
VPEHVKEFIKPWIGRESMERFADSEVDNQYPLRVAAFTSVHSVSFFVSHTSFALFLPFLSLLNSIRTIVMKLLTCFQKIVGDGTTRIYHIGFKGNTSSNRQAINLLLDVPTLNTGDARLIDKLTEKAAAQQRLLSTGMTE